MRLTTTRQTILKPLPLQSSDITQRQLLEELPADAAIEVTGIVPVEGNHTYVLFENGQRGFLYNAHFELPTAANATTTATTASYPKFNLDNSLESRIVKYMMAQEWPLFSGYRERNIVYLEGAEPNGKPNADRLNEWNDICCIISFDDNKPYFAMKPARATTEPGRHYTLNPLNAKGAFRIAIGYHPAAWSYGHHGNDQHQALIQVGKLTGYRDANQDGARTGDIPDTGDNFGVNQHGPYSGQYVDRSSAGCLVRKDMTAHQQFMELLKLDPRFLADRWHRWGAAVIDATHFEKEQH